MMSEPIGDPMVADPLDAVISRIDALIESGSVTVEDLAEIKMDLEDCKAGEVEEEPMESPEGMSGMISKAQNGGYK